MGRLVDIDEVITVISHHHFDEDKNNFDLLIHNLCKEVKKIPTAYNVEKVVAELEEKADSIPIQYEYNYEKGISDGIGDAIDIVKRGGVE